jgi:hypothetical protein
LTPARIRVPPPPTSCAVQHAPRRVALSPASSRRCSLWYVSVSAGGISPPSSSTPTSEAAAAHLLQRTELLQRVRDASKPTPCASPPRSFPSPAVLGHRLRPRVLHANLTTRGRTRQLTNRVRLRDSGLYVASRPSTCIMSVRVASCLPSPC